MRGGGAGSTVGRRRREVCGNGMAGAIAEDEQIAAIRAQIQGKGEEMRHDPGRFPAVRRLAGMHQQLGMLLHERGRDGEARVELERATAYLEELVKETRGVFRCRNRRGGRDSSWNCCQNRGVADHLFSFLLAAWVFRAEYVGSTARRWSCFVFTGEPGGFGTAGASGIDGGAVCAGAGISGPGGCEAGGGGGGGFPARRLRLQF